MDPNFVLAQVMLARLGYAYAVSGDKREAAGVLERLNQISKTRYVPAVYPGGIYEGLGDMDQAYRYAEKAYADRSHYVIYLNVEF